MPMTLLFLLIFTGLFLLWFSNKWQKTGKSLLTVSVCLLFLVCFNPFTSSLMRSLERTYPPITQKNISADYIWVLGSYSAHDTSIPLHSRLGHDGLYRVLEGIRLHKMLPDSRMVFSGYGAGDSKSVAETGAEIALSLGVPRDKITIVSKPKDTWDEAQEAKKIVGNARFILVTSAAHMKRSMYIFNNNGLMPTPAPCGHYIKERGGSRFFNYLPSPGSAKIMHYYLHEQIGVLWLKLLTFFGLTDYA